MSPLNPDTNLTNAAVIYGLNLYSLCIANPLNMSYNEYTVSTNLELFYDSPRLNPWQQFWRSGAGKVLGFGLVVLWFTVCVVLAFYPPTQPLAASLFIGGLKVIALAGATLVVAGAIAGYQSKRTGHGFWNGFGQYIQDSWACEVAISMTLYLVTFGISLAAGAVAKARAAKFAKVNPNLYKVGRYCDIKGAEGLDAHHVGQKAVMKKLVPDYDPYTAPAINVPAKGHTSLNDVGLRISTKTSGFENASELIVRDIAELLRVYPNIPQSAIEELIALNQSMYGIIIK